MALDLSAYPSRSSVIVSSGFCTGKHVVEMWEIARVCPNNVLCRCVTHPATGMVHKMYRRDEVRVLLGRSNKSLVGNKRNGLM